MTTAAKIPLVVFINSKSGGQYGAAVTTKVKKHFPDAHVFDLGEGGPDAGLQQFKSTRFMILACGGDGTVNWILSAVDKLKLNEDARPPIAVLPLGTGNDLSRTLNWGGSYAKNKVRALTGQLDKACVVKMDRWQIQLAHNEEVKGKEEGQAESSRPSEYTMSNYFSIGLDANIALDFHELREQHPEKCKGRVQNLAWYTLFGIQRSFKSESLKPCVELEVDGRPIHVPRKVRILLVLNIPSYSGGGKPWGDVSRASKDGYVPASIDDGLLEIVGFSGAVHTAAVHSNIASAQKLAQGRSIKFITKKPLACQVDGEPWIQQPSVLQISHCGTASLLANSPPTANNEVVEDEHPYSRRRALIRRATTLNRSASTLNMSNNNNTNNNNNNTTKSAPTSPVVTPVASPTSPAITNADAAAQSPKAYQQRQSMIRNHRVSRQFSLAPVAPEERRKGKHYCDFCNMEFHMSYMLDNHKKQGLCGKTADMYIRETKSASSSANSSPAFTRAQTISHTSPSALNDSIIIVDTPTENKAEPVSEKKIESESSEKVEPEVTEKKEEVREIEVAPVAEKNRADSVTDVVDEASQHNKTQHADPASEVKSEKQHEEEQQSVEV